MGAQEKHPIRVAGLPSKIGWGLVGTGIGLVALGCLLMTIFGEVFAGIAILGLYVVIGCVMAIAMRTRKARCPYCEADIEVRKRLTDDGIPSHVCRCPKCQRHAVINDGALRQMKANEILDCAALICFLLGKATKWPACCCSCGEPATKTVETFSYDMAASHRITKTYHVPICENCKDSPPLQVPYLYVRSNKFHQEFEQLNGRAPTETTGNGL